MPLDPLKIDRSFVNEILSDHHDASVAAGCHAYQGYFFSKPVALQDFEQYVCRRTNPTAPSA
jgi:EAL domain-containing protein (putative c-di-GMP-specific phosphodiesterase class I)